ncbi:MAG: hypothetical protein QOK12_3863, partial [Mycobacterium sp.]|nr:hypothetical protein [Mycobacterium sp.]
MTGSAGAEDMAGAERDTGMVEKPASRPAQIAYHRKAVGGLVLETEPPTIEPSEVSALRALIFHLRKMFSDQVT